MSTKKHFKIISLLLVVLFISSCQGLNENQNNLDTKKDETEINTEIDDVKDNMSQDEEKRVKDISGQWQIDGNNLIVTVMRKTQLIGGELVKASPSATFEYSLINAKEVETEIEPPHITTYPLGEIQTSHDFPTNVTIGDKIFWKISDDPFDSFYSENSNDENINQNIENQDIKNDIESFFNQYITLFNESM